MNSDHLKNAIESILFVAGDAVELSTLCGALDIDKKTLRGVLDEMAAEKKAAGAGVLLTRVDSKVQLCSNGDYAPYIDKALQPVKKSRLSQSLLETLAIIAYKQPITRIEIEQIRGVRCNYSIAMLVERGLVQRSGRKKTLGNPMLYTTTDEFLRHFGIAALKNLPELTSDTPLTEPILPSEVPPADPQPDPAE